MLGVLQVFAHLGTIALKPPMLHYRARSEHTFQHREHKAMLSVLFAHLVISAVARVWSIQKEYALLDFSALETKQFRIHRLIVVLVVISVPKDRSLLLNAQPAHSTLTSKLRTLPAA